MNITKPPQQLRLVPGTKDAECHRLLRLLMRAYYGPEHVAVMDCLLHLQYKQANKVTEAELSAELKLSPKLVREVLHLLRVHQLVRGIQQSDHLAPRVEELTSRGRRKGYVRAAPVHFTWHVDFEHVVKVVQFRHGAMLAQLNPKGASAGSGALFACPTPTCSNHHKALDFLKGDVYPDAQGQFVCGECHTIDPLTGALKPTLLRLLAQEDDPAEDRKRRFTAQVKPIQDQLRLVSDLLEKERREAARAAPVDKQAILAAAHAAAYKRPGFTIDFSAQQAAVAAAAAAAAAGTKGAAAARDAAADAASDAARSVESMISVNLASSTAPAAPSAAVASGDGESAAKRARSSAASSSSASSSSTMSALAQAPLPWDKNAPPLSLAKVEEERRAQEYSRSEAVRLENERLAQVEKERFQREYAEQLAKQQQRAEAEAAAASAAASASSAASASAAATPDDSMHDDSGDHEAEVESTMLLGGQQVALSSVTQDDIDAMTADEFDVRAHSSEECSAEEGSRQATSSSVRRLVKMRRAHVSTIALLCDVMCACAELFAAGRRA